MDALKLWLTDGAKFLAVLGLSTVGLVGVLRRLFLWVRHRLARRFDRRRLGAEYNLWRRLAHQSAMPDSGLARRISAMRTDLAAMALHSLREQAGTRLQNAASGTFVLKYNDILEQPGLLIPISLASADGDVVLSVERPTGLGLEKDGLLIIGPAGVGKSMLCRMTEYAWLATDRPATWVVIVVAGDFLGGGATAGSATVGSREWLVTVLARRLFQEQLSPFERRVLAQLVEDRMCLIIDGIDEIADHLSTVDMETFLNSWMFTRANCATVRTSYYESALYGSPALKHCRPVFCQEPAEIHIDRYVDALCGRLYSPAEAVVRARSTRMLRTAAPGLRELTHNPLLLTMCASLRGLELADGSLDVSTIYREFIRLSLSREARAGRRNVPVETLTAVLAEFAWVRFRGSDSQPAGRGAIAAAVASVEGIEPADRQAVIDAVEACPLLTLDHVSVAGLEEYDAKFYHKSFEDYFVAWRLDEWLRAKSANGVDFFERIDTPEVTFFVKEAVVRLSGDKSARRLAALRVQEALTGMLRAKRDAADELTAREKNFAAGQAAYYLGMLSDERLRVWLRELLSTETDFWVRRCGVIGLAFGGAPAGVNAFLDEMLAGIRVGDFAAARRNIGVELGFYGDQGFDPLDPTFDAGGASCARLVGRSCLELRMNIEAANWRMILFNLLYLAKYRTASVESFRAEMAERWSELLEAVALIAADPAKASFPEIAEIRDLAALG